MEIGRRIRQAREELGLSQQEVARLLRISQRAVSYAERQPWLKRSTLERYAEALQRPLSYFLSEEGEAPAAEPREVTIQRAFEIVCRDPEFGFGSRDSDHLVPEAKLDIIRLYEKARSVRLLPDGFE